MDHIKFNGIPIIVIDNFYDDSELKLIWEELELFTYSHKLLPPSQTGSAISEWTKKPEKRNGGLVLDDVWANRRELSNILTVNRKIFKNNMEILRKGSSWFFRIFQCSNDWTYLSYYEDRDHYPMHDDNSSVTVLSWFYKEPKRFRGGDLIVQDSEDRMKIEVLNNRTVIFPSGLKHSVERVSMDSCYANQKLGRYCLTQFLHNS